eukprot:355265-Chlamydomonas_euryale.AAC.5
MCCFAPAAAVPGASQSRACRVQRGAARVPAHRRALGGHWRRPHRLWWACTCVCACQKAKQVTKCVPGLARSASKPAYLASGLVQVVAVGYQRPDANWCTQLAEAELPEV